MTVDYMLSVRVVIMVAAIPLSGPIGAAVVGAVHALVQTHRYPFRARIFNTGMFALLGLIAGVVYDLLSGSHPRFDSAYSVAVHLGLAALAATATMCVLNAALVSIMVRLTNGQRWWTTVVDMLSDAGAFYIAYGLLGTLVYLLWVPVGLGALAAVVMVPPLWAAGWMFAQVGELFQAQERSVTALLTAMDLRRPGEGRHGRQVSVLAGRIANELGVSARTAQEFRTAGALHDVTSLLVRPTIDADASAAELLGHIAFLRSTLPGILQVRENFDGSGFPEGRSGAGISIVARGVAVADAYVLAFDRARSDGLNERSARAAALARLRMQSGLRFDPAVITALEASLSRWDAADIVQQFGGVSSPHHEPSA